jgi:peptidyl-prolyl cis-trans isomerase A (cyclophilin A)
MRKFLFAMLLAALPMAAQQSSGAQPKAIFDTSMGKITCTLFPEQAPLTVANFVGLATGTKDWVNPANGQKMHNTPLYDGTIFHRVIPDFMIQGGDPLGEGTGDPGYQFKDEFSDLTFDRPGRLAMANSGPNTNGSQFFITEVPTPHLNHHHTIFGECDNIDLVKKIARVPRGFTDKPLTPVRINHITIENAPAKTATK